jgi:diguanylate cyclase (GGDEF)-like protein
MLILLAEDDDVSRTVADSLLTKWGHEVLLAEDGEQASKIVGGRIEFDIAIFDWMMPGKAGIDVCRELSAQGREPRPYVMMLTAKGSAENIASGLDAGADDYLLKPFDPQELAARLRVAGRQLELQQRLIAAREQVRFNASHDLGTALLNRASILDALARAARASAPGVAPLAVLTLDIDGFGKFNQQRGIAAGDKVLREVASRLQQQLPPGTEMGRVGPDEFLCLLPACAPSQAQALAEQIRVGLGAAPMRFSWGVASVTASLALATVGGAVDLGALLAALETASAAARKAGGDRVVSVALSS